MAGDEPDWLRIVMDGQIRIWVSDSDGQELTLSFLGADDIFCEIALLDGLHRSAHATTLEKTNCLFLPAAALAHAMQEDTELTQRLIRTLCELLRRNLGTMTNFVFVGLEDRLVQVWAELAMDNAKMKNGAAYLNRKYSQADLALLLGASREAVSKRFKALQRDGLVAMEENFIFLPDRAAMTERAKTL